MPMPRATISSRATLLAPDDVHAHFGLGAMALSRHNLPEAIHELSALAAANPSMIQASAALGEAYIQSQTVRPGSPSISICGPTLIRVWRMDGRLWALANYLR